ncbi:hypothetical protein [uncultured Phocaeicola sp.]|uniref:hypothetical protein n=1 Tax=uncultured Phocaeicola sp. TaxID=990718 RepID=UPI0025A00BA6|nr:hypothetical protein [uncultured Phocaeicola sp.]
MEKKEDEYIDLSLEEKGITVIYRNSPYKKKIKLIANIGRLLNGCESDSNRIVRKLNKRIGEYFDFMYKLDDFILSGMRLVTDINVGSHENIQAYLKVFRRIGRVKGFSPVSYECFEDVDSFCLDGNSNGVEFMIYDLAGSYRKQLNEGDIGRKRFKELIKESEGILRTEVRLAKTKAVRVYAGEEDIFGQIINLSEKRKDIFLEIFVRIIPFGDFYKKGKAEEIIWREIKDARLRRRMLRLVELIPEKKSLYLAQKAMECRNMEKVVEAFAKINLSPVTISKRQDVKWLKNIYEGLLEI